MNIAIDISQIVYKTGVSRYTTELIKALLKIDKANHYLLFGSSFRQKKQMQLFIDSLSGNNFSSKILSLPPTILELIFNRWRFVGVDQLVGKIDIFHSSDWTQPRASAKNITTIHDLAVIKFPKLFHPKIVAVHKQRLKLVKEECDLIIAVSKNTKNDIIDLLKIPESKIIIVYEAASDVFRQQNNQVVENIKKKYKIDGDYMLTVATFGARKNLENLVTALKKLNSKNISLVVVGNFNSLPVKNVRSIGFISDTDLAALYSGARVVVYPSVYEGFGFPIVEAMSCKTPVISSDRSSLKEVGGDAAIYIDPEDSGSIGRAIIQVLSMPANEYKDLKEKSMIQAAKFSWQRSAIETLSAYKQLYLED